MVINHVVTGMFLQLVVGGTLELSDEGFNPQHLSTCTSFVGFSEDNLGTKGDKLMGKHKMVSWNKQLDIG